MSEIRLLNARNLADHINMTERPGSYSAMQAAYDDATAADMPTVTIYHGFRLAGHQSQIWWEQAAAKNLEQYYGYGRQQAINEMRETVARYDSYRDYILLTFFERDREMSEIKFFGNEVETFAITGKETFLV